MNSIKQRIADISRGIVPDGYQKHGKYGVFPEDWRITTLGEITSRLSERNGDSTDYPAYSINNQVGFIPQREQFEEGSYDGLDKSSYRIVERGQFAYNPARINVGSIGMLKDCDKAIISSLYVCFDTSNDVCKSYLENWFHTIDFYKEIIRNTEGSVREYLFYENFSDIRIVLPTFEEQKRIAEILDCCDRVIRLRRELVEEKKKQKKSLMQKLLNPDSGFRLPGFKGEWKTSPLKEITSYVDYRGKTPTKNTNGIPLITAKNVKKGKIDYLVSQEYVSEEEYAEIMHRGLPQVGDVLVTTEAPCGNVAQVDNPNIALAQRIIKFRGKSGVLDNRFLMHMLLSEQIQEKLFSLSTGGTAQGIKGATLHSLTIDYPSFLEQSKISEILSSSDQELDLLEQDLAQWELKKKSLAQLLLTGKVRV